MPTVIDSLVVELGLDPKKFTKGQQEAIDAAKKGQQDLEQRLKIVESSGERAAHSFSNLRTQALGAIAVFTGGRGIQQFAQYIAQTDASVARTSRTFGLSTEALSHWRGAATAAGGSADGITATITGLITQFQNFALTGESSVIPYFRSMGIQIADAEGKMRPFSELLMDFARWAKGRDPAQASAVLSAVGIDAGTISMILQGESAVQKLIATQKEMGGVNKESAAAAEGLVKMWGEMTSAAEALGRAILTKLAPALTAFLGGWREIFSAFSKGELVEGSIAKRLWDGVTGKQTGEWSWSEWMNKKKSSYSDAKTSIAAGAIPGTPTAQGSGAFTSQSEKESFIRSEAAKRGIDPNTAMAVARSEGFNGFNSSIPGERSYGAFQLNYSKNPSKPSLGDLFTKKTGLDASDKSTEREGIKFALDNAAYGGRGWAPWYGARNTGIGNWQGLPGPGATAPAGSQAGSTVTNTTTIGELKVVTQATDAEGIAGSIKPALQKQSLADQANSGLN